MSGDKSLENFLTDVDEINEIIQNLSSSDASCLENAMLKADKKIAALKENDDIDGTRTKINRTVINKSPSGNWNFLEHLEKDAKERAERRKENESLATALKILGNEAFAKGDYETAVQHYSDGLEKLKDMQVLYTNRAQAYIKIEKYQDAITDCEWALKCNEKCVKAYVHMGRAYLGLKDYNEARKCYLMITKIDPKQEKTLKDYLNQVDSQERKNREEKKALEEFEAGTEEAVSVVELLKKLSKPDQIELYYSGGFKFLTKVVKDCTGQTLFRTNNGFCIIRDNKLINRSLITTQPDPVQSDLCLSVLTLWQTLCDGNEENQHVFISHPDVSKQILSLLSSEVPDIQIKTLALLSVYSKTERGRSLLLKYIDSANLFQSLLKYVMLKDGRAIDAVILLHCLSQEERLKMHFLDNFSDTSLPSFNHLLRNVKICNRAVLPRYIGVIGNVIKDKDMRRQVASSLECWDSCLAAMEECNMLDIGEEPRDILFAVLGLMLNLCLETSPAVQERAVDISDRCMTLLSSKDGGVITRCVGILSRVLPQCSAAVVQTVQGGVVKKLIKLLKAGGQRTSVYAVKVLAVCTKEDAQARKDVIKYDKNFGILSHFLCSEDEIIAGNTALCLGNCFEIPGAASSLLHSDILKLLLTHAGGDAKRTTVQKNAAIALGKLCTADPRFVIQLRELNGIEILNACMKYIK
ncbi:tetratricopeptide repeat protein 12 [Discoglossus pictus]